MLIRFSELTGLILVGLKGIDVSVVSIRDRCSCFKRFLPDIGSSLSVDLLIRRGVHQVLGDVGLVSIGRWVLVIGVLVRFTKLAGLVFISFKCVNVTIVGFRSGLGMSNLFLPNVRSYLPVDLLIRRSRHQVFCYIWLIPVRRWVLVIGVLVRFSKLTGLVFISLKRVNMTIISFWNRCSFLK